MSGSAIAVVLIANVVAWGGIFFGVRWAMRRGKKNAEHLGRAEFTGPVSKNGYVMEVRRLWVAKGAHGRSRQIEFVDYCVQLPPPLHRLSLIEGEAFESRTNRLQPPAALTRVGAPATSDDAFNGMFDFVTTPDAATSEALHDATLRELLQDVHRAYANVWVDNGTMRVFQEGAPDEEEIDVNAEFLTGVAFQIASRSTKS